MKKRVIALCFTVVCLTGCSAVATKYKFDPVVRDCYFWEKCKKDEKTGLKTKVVLEKIAVAQYTCSGAGCEADFKNETMKGGKLFDLPPMKLEN